MECKITCKLLIILAFIIPCTANAGTSLRELISVKSKEEWKLKTENEFSVVNPHLRCKEELSLRLVPETCYESSILTPDTAIFLNRQCHEAVQKIENLKVLGRLVQNNSLSEECRNEVRVRGMVVAYKLEDRRPAEAYEFFSQNSGPNIVNRIRHAKRTANQSN